LVSGPFAGNKIKRNIHFALLAGAIMLPAASLAQAAATSDGTPPASGAGTVILAQAAVDQSGKPLPKGVQPGGQPKGNQPAPKGGTGPPAGRRPPPGVAGTARPSRPFTTRPFTSRPAPRRPDATAPAEELPAGPGQRAAGRTTDAGRDHHADAGRAPIRRSA